MSYQKPEIDLSCHECQSKLYQGQCVNPACPAFCADSAMNYVEDELLPDMCLDFEGFAARQNIEDYPFSQ